MKYQYVALLTHIIFSWSRMCGGEKEMHFIGILGREFCWWQSSVADMCLSENLICIAGNLSWHNIEWSFFHSGRIWVVWLAKYYPVFLFTHCTLVQSLGEFKWSSWQNIIDWSCLQSLGECPAVRNARLMSHFLSTILTQRLWCEHSHNII